MKKTLIAFIAVAALATAQTKTSGTAECGKPDEQKTVKIGDRSDHTFNLSQSKCTWPKPMDFAGVQTKEIVFTNFVEDTAGSTKEHGYAMNTLANGDNLHVRTQGSGTMKDNKINSEGKWTAYRGTGKMRSLKTSGTYKCSGTPDKLTCEIEGEYTEAAAKKK